MLLQGEHTAAWVTLLYFLHPALVLSFNLDTGNVIRKAGEPGSLFGFSLAAHRQLNPDQTM